MIGTHVPLAGFACGGDQFCGAAVEAFVKISEFCLVIPARPDASLQRWWLAGDAAVTRTRSAAMATARDVTAALVQVASVG